MSMSTIRMRDILALIAVVAILLAMIPTIVLADDPSNNSDNISVTFGSGNDAPVVNTVTLYKGDDTGIETSMDPTIEYSVQVNVTDNNTLNDLTEMKVTIYYNGNGTYSEGAVPTTADNQTCGIYTWTPSGLFSMDSALNGSWSLGTCTAPTLTASSGTFLFHFTPGKVAKESDNSTDEWQIHASVTDSLPQSAINHQEDLNMNWYGEMSITDTSLALGSLNLGATKQSGAFTVTYWSNGNYSEQVKALSDNWTGTGSNSLTLVTGTPGAGEFKLVANDENDSSGGEAKALTTSYQTIENGGVITSQSGNPELTNYLWITLGSSNIPFATYSGTIYYQILDR